MAWWVPRSGSKLLRWPAGPACVGRAVLLGKGGGAGQCVTEGREGGEGPGGDGELVPGL